MNRNGIIITVVSIVAIFGFLFGVYFLTNNSSSTSTQIIADTKTIKSTDHLKWSPTKTIILTEYGDLQCPACKNFHDIIKAQIEGDPSVSSKVTKKITFVYRHFPLVSIHQNALVAAYAAEASSNQNKFFPFVDMLYGHQDDWANLGNPQDKFLEYAKNLKMDVNKFKSDMNAQNIKDRVNADMQSGNDAGIDSTPTFFLDGKKLENINTIDDFKNILLSAAK